MKIYLVKIGQSVFKIQALDLYELSSKLAELCSGEFTIIAIQFPFIRV